MVIVALVVLCVTELLAVIVVDPEATPLRLTEAEVLPPATIVVVAGTVAMPGALLVKLTTRLETTVSLPA